MVRCFPFGGENRFHAQVSPEYSLFGTFNILVPLPPRARELMGFLGLVPSEHTSGSKRRQGAITKTGNSHARRVLVEAAWNYRFPARVSRGLQVRQEDQPKAVREIAWRAQLRLAQRYRHLSARKLALNKVCVAIARELSAFVWDIAHQVKPIA